MPKAESSSDSQFQNSGLRWMIADKGHRNRSLPAADAVGRRRLKDTGKEYTARLPWPSCLPPKQSTGHRPGPSNHGGYGFIKDYAVERIIATPGFYHLRGLFEIQRV
jgi:hypothetical protein